jgi:hypothetical protein
MGAREQELHRLTGDRAQQIAAWSVMLYLTIYTFESPIRYLLYLVGASSAILGRDVLIIGPLVLIGVRGLLARNLHSAFWLFAAFIILGGTISLMSLGVLAPVALGTKMLLNVLFGIVAGATLILPGKWTARYLAVLWLATVLGLVLEKYVVSYPWIGIHAIIGGVEVEISRDWQIADLTSQRVGGFTKQSISAASLVTQLALISIFQFRSYFIRSAMLALTLGCVYLTTQKGALIGIFLVSLILIAPSSFRLAGLRVAALGAVLLDIGLPFFTNGLIMTQGHGVFSGASFAQRIMDTWPKSLIWISNNQIFPFGTGVGGIGQSQALVGNLAQHYPDNMFLLLYAFFGIPCFLLFGWIVYAIIRSITIDPAVAGPALAVLAFNLFYGAVVTVVEDQVGALCLGASIGILLNASRIPDRIGHPSMSDTKLASV